MPYPKLARKPTPTVMDLNQNPPWFELGLFGVVSLLAILFASIPIFQMLLDGIRIWIHEIGHALAAWCFSRRAFPLPFGWTNIEPDKSLFVYFGILSLCIYWVYFLIQREKVKWVFLPSLIIFVQFLASWLLDDIQFEYWVTISGIRAEFLLSTLLIWLYFTELPPYFKWSLLRIPVLFAGVFTLWSSASLWLRAKTDYTLIPWGTMLGGGDDSGGDLDQLQDVFHWSTEKIVSHFSSLGIICGLSVLILIVYQIIKVIRQKQR